MKKTKGKTSYEIPFRALFVCEKQGGAWQVVHAHLSVMP